MINILQQEIEIGNTPAKTYFQNRDDTAEEMRHLLKFLNYFVFAFSFPGQSLESMSLIKFENFIKHTNKSFTAPIVSNSILETEMRHK